MTESFGKYDELNKAKAELDAAIKSLDPNIAEFEDYLNFYTLTMELSAGVFIFRKRLLSNLTKKFSKNYWAWHYQSEFLHYETEFSDKAYSSAKCALNLARENNDFIGAISRHFISLAYQRKEFKAIDEEVSYLSTNPDKESRIIKGLALDLLDVPRRKFLSPETVGILQSVKLK